MTSCFSADVARRLVELRAGAKTQARIDELAERANEGDLTEDERAEYTAYVYAIDLIGLLQAQARRRLDLDGKR